LWNSIIDPKRRQTAQGGADRLGLNIWIFISFHSICVSTGGTSRIRRIKTAMSFYDRSVTLPIPGARWRVVRPWCQGHRTVRTSALNELLTIYEDPARIKPAGRSYRVKLKPYLPTGFWKILRGGRGVLFLAFAPLGRGIEEAGAARTSSYFSNCCTSWKDVSTGAVGLGGAAQHGTLTTPRTAARAREILTFPPASGRRI